MGSKTLENDDSGSHGHAPDSEKPFRVGGEPRGARTGRHGDGGIGDGAGDGSGNDDDDDEAALTGQAALTEEGSGTKSKKKRKPRKKKKKAATNGQTSPPRIKLDDLFPSGEFPKGEWQEYGGGVAEENTRRTTDAEVRYGRLVADRGEGSEFLRNYRKAAEVHRQVRRWVQDTVKPGDNLTDIAVGIEDGVRALLDNAGLGTGDGLKSGMGFPTGLSVNHGVAHYTPNPGQKEVVLGYEDVVKVDFGVHINGWIVDSAFTVAFDPTYDNLLAAVKDATNSGIKAAGVDVRICDISAVIQETMESYEVEIRGKTFPVKPVRNLSAHDIHHYHIHGNKSIPFVKNSDQTKMEEGEVFAIETFGSTGRGFARDDEGIYGYGLEDSTPVNVSNLGLSSARRLYKTIKDNFGTIVFCRRYLDRLGQEKYLAGMNSLIANGIVEPYKPLMDIQGSYSAQFEHTILLRETGKEVISRGEDY